MDVPETCAYGFANESPPSIYVWIGGCTEGSGFRKGQGPQCRSDPLGGSRRPCRCSTDGHGDAALRPSRTAELAAPQSRVVARPCADQHRPTRMLRIRPPEPSREPCLFLTLTDQSAWRWAVDKGGRRRHAWRAREAIVRPRSVGAISADASPVSESSSSSYAASSAAALAMCAREWHMTQSRMRTGTGCMTTL